MTDSKANATSVQELPDADLEAASAAGQTRSFDEIVITIRKDPGVKSGDPDKPVILGSA